MTGKRRSRERGLSLLETSLALAILASMSAGIFMAVRSQQEGFSTVLQDLRTLQQTEDALDVLLRDMRMASSFTMAPGATNSLSFMPAGGGPASTLSLGPAIAGDPRNRPLIYTVNGTPRPLTKARTLINHNPGSLTLQGAVADGTVPLFTITGGNRVTITLVLQARPNSPVRYLRTSVTRRRP